MTFHIYPEVKHRALRKGKCPVCGKQRNRSRMFMQTISPFNKNEDETMKSFAEVHAAVLAEASMWAPDFTCASHEDGAK